MPELSKEVIREPGVDTPEAYARRVRRLAAIYAGMTLTSAAGAVLLLWRAKLLVTLAQRSNVETLTIAFGLVFFIYVGLLGAQGLRGAVRIAGFALAERLGDRAAVEKRKVAALAPPGQEDVPEAALNVLLELAEKPFEPFQLEVKDEYGLMGRLRVDGARVSLFDAPGRGSNDLFAYFARQVQRIVHRRGEFRTVDVVHWRQLDDESTEVFLGHAEFARNLGRKQGEALWPTVRLNEAECAEVEKALCALCSALREESLLPLWEYEVEHKIPVVPEPLGLVSLSRSERRADPSATMGCAFLVVLGLLLVLVLFIFFPPWTPGL